MEITKNIYIQDSALYVNIELDSNNAEQGVYFTHLTIYNSKSFIDGNPLWEKNYESGRNVTKIEEDVSESNLNVRNQTLYESCYPTNVNTSLFIIVASLGYTSTYQQNHSCSEMPSIVTYAVYNPCHLYNELLPSINELESNCNQLPMNFINGMLKKKAIDACIGAGHFGQACKYWCKFYQHGAVTFSSASTGGGCGCHG